MKIIGLNGSPRADGNTAKLVKEILSGASDNGADVQIFNLAKMNVAPCIGCYACKKDGTCILDDDMQKLYDEIQASDVIVLGSPIYMWEMTAQAKSFVDRLCAFIKPDFSTRLNGEKKLILAFTQGNPDSEMFNFYFEYLAKMFGFLAFNVEETIVVTGTVERSDILSQEFILETARQMGKDL
ncbi:flavodoxin family protein [Methanococcoides sp. LMO-2]|uniref:Flavodoxin family protein n=1 Tax=Methanococcoides cohabitans TaxID=3136559 RepID=A0ABU9KSL7_9EURY